MGATPRPVVRRVAQDDLVAVRALNADNVPAVGTLDDDRVQLFLADPRVTFEVAVDGDRVVGLFVGMVGGVPYGSSNYRWFEDRHARIAYVDRVAVAPRYRGTGLAHRLYARWFDAATDHAATVVCAEVNVAPPNPRSLAFHARLGFVEVARRSPYGDDGPVVAMLERPAGA